MTDKNPLKIFKAEAPEVQKAYDGVIQALIATPGLDAKTKQLLYIAMKVVAGDKNAVRFHVPMAKAAGATRDEIKETIVLSLTVIGLKGITEYLPMAMELFDNQG